MFAYGQTVSAEVSFRKKTKICTNHNAVWKAEHYKLFSAVQVQPFSRQNHLSCS